jgi:rhodanese-related sulfurtransferase
LNKRQITNPKETFITDFNDGYLYICLNKKYIMIQFIKNLLGFGPHVDIQALIKNGAKIVDVRTPAEFKDGHVKGSINLPLQTLGSQMNKLKKDEVIITCCRSGSRSGMARRQLQAAGFMQVYNGGPWNSIKR